MDITHPRCHHSKIMYVSVSLVCAFLSKFREIPLEATTKNLESSVEPPCNPKQTKDCAGGTRHVGGFATHFAKIASICKP